ncbi:hypothetical protein ACJX0J_011673 [Zea mays]
MELPVIIISGTILIKIRIKQMMGWLQEAHDYITAATATLYFIFLYIVWLTAIFHIKRISDVKYENSRILTWTNFATSLKHEMQEFGISNLIARAKDIGGKRVVEGTSSVHVLDRRGYRAAKNLQTKAQLYTNITPTEEEEA